MYKQKRMWGQKPANFDQIQDYPSLRTIPRISLRHPLPGHFWGIVETRDYMRGARVDLKELIHSIAYWEETIELWEKVLLRYSEMLRLCSSDNLGLRF